MKDFTQYTTDNGWYILYEDTKILKIVRATKTTLVVQAGKKEYMLKPNSVVSALNGWYYPSGVDGKFYQLINREEAQKIYDKNQQATKQKLADYAAKLADMAANVEVLLSIGKDFEELYSKYEAKKRK